MDKIRTEGTGEDEDMRRKSSLENVPSNIGEGRENTRLPFTGSPWYIYTRVMSSKIFNTAGNLAFSYSLEKVEGNCSLQWQSHVREVELETFSLLWI